MAAAFDLAHYDQARRELDEHHQRVDVAPSKRQLLGRFTVVCLVLNRTIGSGIFTTPSKILGGTGSIGGALLLWGFGGLVRTAGLLCWLELGLTVPIRRIPGTSEQRSVPRSGGEKNFLEFIFSKPKFAMTCVYGIAFIVLGNLAGNAIAFGRYAMRAAGHSDPAKSSVIGIAIGALTLCSLLHIFSRRGGIAVNNMFAVVKVSILLTIIVLGFVKAGGGLDHEKAPKATSNLDPDISFESKRHDVGSYAQSFLYVFYTYSGYEQPFYVLSEVRKPKKIFPTYTLLSMLIATTLFVLVNISFFCAVPADTYTSSPAKTELDMATVFFGNLFVEHESAQRAMSALIATSIFGNILVMTFTAARVKQEIAKEGILPFSLFFATGHTTPWSRLKARWQSGRSGAQPDTPDDHLEQTPMAALALHWLSSIILIAVTSMLESNTAYSFLVSENSYVIRFLNGFLVSGGLLYLKFDRRRRWRDLSNFKPWLDPLPAILFFVVNGFVLFAAFAKPAADSPFSSRYLKYEWYLVPTIGLSSLSWGAVWWIGLKGVMRHRRKTLVVTRVPFIVQDDEDETQWVQRAELVDHEWRAKVGSRSTSLEEYEMG